MGIQEYCHMLTRTKCPGDALTLTAFANYYGTTHQLLLSIPLSHLSIYTAHFQGVNLLVYQAEQPLPQTIQSDRSFRRDREPLRLVLLCAFLIFYQHYSEFTHQLIGHIMQRRSRIKMIGPLNHSHYSDLLLNGLNMDQL